MNSYFEQSVRNPEYIHVNLVCDFAIDQIRIHAIDVFLIICVIYCIVPPYKRHTIDCDKIVTIFVKKQLKQNEKSNRTKIL